MSRIPNPTDDASLPADPGTERPSWEGVAVRLFIVSLPVVVGTIAAILAAPHVLRALDLPITRLPLVVGGAWLVGTVLQCAITARVLWTMRGERPLRWMAAALGLVLVLDIVERLIAG